MNFEGHRGSGGRITRGLSRGKERRETGCVYFSAEPRQTGELPGALSARIRERRETRREGEGLEGRRRKNSTGKTAQTEDERTEKRAGWKKAALPAKHFFLLKFARASRAKRVFHPEPATLFLSFPTFPSFFPWPRILPPPLLLATPVSFRACGL